MLSIIIPTLNEEECLPRLLASIQSQDFHDYEIIVADAGSTDSTVAIARQYGAIVTKGGLPAKGRNQGAKIAKGDVLFLLDADTILSEHFLSQSLDEFQRRKLDIASFCLRPYPKRSISYFFINTFYNTLILISGKWLAHAAVGTLVKKNVFDVLQGYDETIMLAEDHDFARRAVKKGVSFAILRSKELLFSDRRFRKDGWMTIGIKYFLCELHMIFLGPVRTNLFNYKFNHYKNTKK